LPNTASTKLRWLSGWSLRRWRETSLWEKRPSDVWTKMPKAARVLRIRATESALASQTKAMAPGVIGVSPIASASFRRAAPQSARDSHIPVPICMMNSAGVGEAGAAASGVATLW